MSKLYQYRFYELNELCNRLFKNILAAEIDDLSEQLNQEREITDQVSNLTRIHGACIVYALQYFPFWCGYLVISSRPDF